MNDPFPIAAPVQLIGIFAVWNKHWRFKSKCQWVRVGGHRLSASTHSSIRFNLRSNN